MMSTAVRSRPRDDGDMVTTLEVGPGGLDRFLELVPRHPGRITYQNGILTLMSPSINHERGVQFFGSIVSVIAEELEIPFVATRSTLYVRNDLQKGVEPDASYYFEDRHAIAGLEGSVDLSRHPAPALVLEVVWTHSATAALTIHAALGVPEVWVYDIPPSTVTFLVLDHRGVYHDQESSRVFPFLTATDVVERLRAASSENDDGRVLRQLRVWVREVLGPRRGIG